MEFLICLWLSSLVMSIRPVSDMVHAFKGKEPPHLTKARLRAERQAQKAAEKRAAAEKRQVRTGEGKPTLGDVIRTYWGDAMTDAIASHNRRRAEKQRQGEENSRATAEGRPATTVTPGPKGRLSRFGKLLWNGPQKPDEAPKPHLVEGVDAAKAVEEVIDAGPLVTCDECGDKLTDFGDGLEHPAGSKCGKSWKAAQPPAKETTTAVPPSATRPGRPRPSGKAPQGPKPYRKAGIAERQAQLSPLMKRLNEALRERDWVLAADVLNQVDIDFPDAINDPWAGLTTFGLEPGTTQWMNLRTVHYWVDRYLKSRKKTPATEGDKVTDTSAPTTGTATGDAHNVETALQQCEALDDDLIRIDTALDVIDEAIGSAGGAAERIQAFLTSKNVDDSAVGGMAQATDMLSAEKIKSLIDCIAAARAGVKSAEEELRRLQDLEQQLQGADGSILNGR